jgi:hypothetical protein
MLLVMNLGAHARRTVPSCICSPRFEPYSIRALTLLGKGGGEPPHSKVGWRRSGFERLRDYSGVRLTLLAV